MTTEIGRALRLIRAHPSVLDVTSEKVGKVTLATVRIRTEMPAEWRGKGESPSGVRTVEPVTFRFYDWFPTIPPTILLRDNFNNAHPHLQPGSNVGAPEPCLFAGSTRELLRMRGILGLVEQLVDWLERASRVELIDPKQGWEPVRRDHVDDIIIAEAGWLRGLVTADGGCSAFNAEYRTVRHKNDEFHSVRVPNAERIALGPQLADSFRYKDMKDLGYSGNGLGLVAWSGKKPNGSAFIADKYLPETVSTVPELLERAALLGCRESLAPKLALIQERMKAEKMRIAIPLAVILLARRPIHLIGSTSDIELCPYVVELEGSDDLSRGSRKAVRPAMHLEDLSVSLLRTASGNAPTRSAPWSMIGAGSVGSKIATHLARAGRGPNAIIDRGTMRPHNFARHSTIPSAVSRDGGLYFSKVLELGDTLKSLNQPAIEHAKDIVSHIAADGAISDLVPKGTALLVNTTASATVREVLGAKAHSDRPRLVEACLMGQGSVGVLTIEGAGNNPSTTDMMCETYREILERRHIAEKVFADDGTEMLIGQGCSALTMPLRDSRVSLFSASFAERIMQLQDFADDQGVLCLGSVDKDGISIGWSEQRFGPRKVFTVSGGPEVRVSPAVDVTILKEIRRRPKVETGGIIIGRYCDVSNSFHIVDTLPAPPDSKFSAEEFVLGTKGLRSVLRKLAEESNGALYPLGTWHSHLVSSGPSAKDMKTAILLSTMQHFPLLMLIWTPEGYTGLVTEVVEGDKVA